VISGVRRDVDEICALLDCYAVCSGNSVPTFRDNISVPYSRVSILEDGTNRFPQTLVRNYHYTLRNNPAEGRSQLGGLFC